MKELKAHQAIAWLDKNIEIIYSNN